MMSMNGLIITSHTGQHDSNFAAIFVVRNLDGK